MLRKVLIGVWLVFSVVWSGTCIFVYFLGAGMSPVDVPITLPLLLYWLLPIGVPAMVYKIVRKRQSSTGEKPDSPD